ncbi:MAG: GDP-mannose dehydrogenase [Candidatus Bathyarchaeota archaeon]|nr:GDP-mannose dehydrogenase [Candidatus Bathyarchaeota archaeon]
MVKPVVLVVGLGEVGRPLFELLRESEKFEVYGWDVDEKKMRDVQQGDLPADVDVLHVCYRCRYQETFVKTTVDYVKQFRPELTIINSTVPPGTTEKIHTISGSHMAHSPVRGMHKSRESMKRYLLFLTKYIGGVDDESVRLACKHFEDFGLKTKVLKSTVETELAKLFETTYRAWMIACFQEMHRISRRFGANLDEVMDFLEDTHIVQFDRPIHFPDVIGGHCLIPNAKLLLKSYDSKFLRLILGSNEKRKEEIKDKDVRREVEETKKRVNDIIRNLSLFNKSI